jgi:hypothetical protein
MENAATEQPRTAREKVVTAPVEAGTVVLSGAEKLAQDVGHGVTEAVAVLVAGTESVAEAISGSREALGPNPQRAVSAAPEA